MVPIPSSFRPSVEEEFILKTLMDKYQASQSWVVKLAIRTLGEKEGVKMPKEPKDSKGKGKPKA